MPAKRKSTPAEKLRNGEWADYQGKQVQIECVTRFWGADGYLITGSLFLRGDNAHNSPRNLREFCSIARVPRQ